MKRLIRSMLFWKILLGIGICPFAAPFVTWLWQVLIQSSFTFTDWMILYSFVFWWTYVIGLGLIVIAGVHLKRGKAETGEPQKDKSRMQ